jgi:CBS domain-containing protein
MATVKDILATKGPKVFSVPPEATALEAAVLMNEHKIGALIVLDGERVVGMFTERDILRRIVAEERAAEQTRVGDLMTKEVICCTPQTALEEARVAMKNRRIRHLPVVEDDRLLGMISIGDLNAYEAHDHQVTIHVLEEYIHSPGLSP